jgi:hypothetical protein
MKEEKVHLAVLREYYWSLPSWKAAKENGLVSGVNIVVKGAPMGVRRVPDGRNMAPCHGYGGMREEKVHLAVLREYYWSLK